MNIIVKLLTKIRYLAAYYWTELFMKYELIGAM